MKSFIYLNVQKFVENDDTMAKMHETCLTVDEQK